MAGARNMRRCRRHITEVITVHRLNMILAVRVFDMRVCKKMLLCFCVGVRHPFSLLFFSSILITSRFLARLILFFLLSSYRHFYLTWILQDSCCCMFALAALKHFENFLPPEHVRNMDGRVPPHSTPPHRYPSHIR